VVSVRLSCASAGSVAPVQTLPVIVVVPVPETCTRRLIVLPAV
jgi:hypothetical protein